MLWTGVGEADEGTDCYGGGDSSTFEKYFKFDQRSNNIYLLEYKFDWNDAANAKTDSLLHFHIPASITITWFYGNKQIRLATIAGTMSSTQCYPPDIADDQRRWTTGAIEIYKKSIQK